MKDFLHTKIGKYLRHFLIAVALVTISGGGILYFSQKIVYGAPVSTLLRNILPETTNRYDVGTTTNIWNRLFVNYASTTALNAVTLCLDGDTCRTTWPTGGSGGGDPFTHPSLTSSATTSLMLFNGGASTTLLSVFDKAYFGGTATSTFDSTGFLTLPSGFLSQASSTVVGQFNATTASTSVLTITNPLSSSNSPPQTDGISLIVSSTSRPSTIANSIWAGFGNAIFSCESCGGTGGNLLGIANYGSGSVGINTWSARGSTASPSATQSGDNIYFMGGRGYGASAWNAGSKAAIVFVASQNYTNTANGTYITLETTPNDSVTRAERVRINNDGLVSIHNSASSTRQSIFDRLYVGGTGTTTIFGSEATSTFGAGVESPYLNITGTAATSTFARGIDLSGGCFAINGTCVGGSGTVTSVTATAPLFSSGGATPNITWAGLATTSQPTSSNLLVSNGGAGVYGVATTSLGVTAPITFSGTMGAQIGGAAGTFGCTSASAGVTGCLTGTDWSTFNNKQATLSATWPQILTGATLSFDGLSTTTPWTIGQLAYVGAGNRVTSVATSSLTINAPLTTSGTAGALVGGTALTIDIDDIKAADLDLADITLNDFTNDAGFITSAVWPFTPSTYGGVANQSTTTPFWLNGTQIIASTTFFTQSSTTMLTNTGNTYFTGLTSALVSAGSGGLLAEYAGSSCTNQFVRSLDAAGAATCATVGTGDVSGLDISADTNLTAGDNITLNDDDLDLDTTLTGLTAITVTNASTTNWTASLYASTSKFYADGLGCSAGQYITWTGGTFGCAADSTGSGAWPWTLTTHYGTSTNATTTPLWQQTGLFASSTSHFTQASTSLLTVKDTAYFGSGGAGDSAVQFGPAGYEWTLGFDDTDDSFTIASSTALGTSNMLSILKGATSTFGAGVESTYLNITGTSATSTFARGINLAAGCFAINGTCVGAGGSGTVTNVATTWPVIGGPITTTGTLSFGWSTTSQPSSSNLFVSDGGSGFYGVATGTISSSGGITTTAGRSAVGGALAISCDVASGSIPGCLAAADWTTFNGKESVLTFGLPMLRSANTINWVGLATTSQPTSSNLLVSNGGAGVYGVATTSVGCSGFISCTGFNALGAASTITTTGDLPVADGGTGASDFGGQGWLHVTSLGASPIASTSPTVNYLTATSTSATSTFAFGVEATRFNGTTASSSLNGLHLTNIKSCSQALETDGNGGIICGTDATGAGGGAWPFTSDTYGGVANQSTTTPFWLKNTQIIASTTLFTQASTTLFTNTGDTWLTGLTSAVLGTDTTGKVVATTSIGYGYITGGPTGANPTGTVGLTAVNGTASTFLRSDGAPALSQAIIPTWTGLHTFNTGGIISNASSTWTAQLNLQQASSTMLTNTGNTYFTGITSALGLFGSGGLLGEYAGSTCAASNVAFSTDASGALTCVQINNAYWSGTDLSVANGGTGLSTFGGTNTPLFTSTADNLTHDTDWTYNGTTNLMTVVNASTTALSASGYFGLPTGATTPLALGSLFLDTTSNNLTLATSTTGHILLGGATTTLFAFNVASTSPDLKSGGIIEIPEDYRAMVVTGVICKVDAGTSVVINLSDGTNDTGTATCTTTSTQYAFTANNSFNAYERTQLEVGTVTGSVDYLVMRFVGYRTSD